MKRILAIFTVILFVVPFFGSLLIFGEQSGVFLSSENRQAVSMTGIDRFTSHGLKRFFGNKNQYIDDRLMGKEELVPVLNKLLLDPEKVSRFDLSKGLIGKNEWIFLGNDYSRVIDKHCQENFPLDNYEFQSSINKIDLLKDTTEELGGTYVLFIAPDKHNIYCDELPQWLGDTCKNSEIYTRKLISKKLMDKIPKLKEQVYNAAKSSALSNYVWDIIVKPSLGYSFARVHGYSYSLIACQCAYLATYFPRVYWNTACLRVDAGIGEEASTSYDKIAKAVGNMTAYGIKVKPVNINLSSYFFEPDETTNSILYGMKCLNGVGGEVIDSIIQKRPYTSLQDFIDKTNSNKTVTLSLIKAGAFDQFDDRKQIMEDYLRQMSSPKTKLTMQNFKSLMDNNLLPQDLEFQQRLFVDHIRNFGNNNAHSSGFHCLNRTL